MTTALVAYLVGYFISFGTCLGIFEKSNYGAYCTSFVWGFTSWIGVGMFMADFIKEKIKDNGQ